MVIINWYKIIESILLNGNKFTLLIKFIQINSCNIYSTVIKKCILYDTKLGIINIFLLINFPKSHINCKLPLRPTILGPKRLWV